MSIDGIDPPGVITLPLHEEALHISRRVVDTGRGVRVDKRVTVRQEQVDTPVWRDAVEVRHIPIDRIVATADAPVARYEGATLILPVLEEVLVLEKRCRIKEELHITTTRSEQRHIETVALRAEEVTVEWLDKSTPTLQKAP